jgi:putative ABC transport system ATP-binding protein
MVSLLSWLKFAVQPAPIVSQAAQVAVRCSQLTKEFGTGEARVQVLRGIDLEIQPGELTLLVGPSGCGKTTLISVIAGLLEPSAGQVEVFGHSLGQLSPRKLVEYRAKNIGFVFQQYNLIPSLTAAENAAIPLLIQGMNWSQAVKRGRDMLAQVGLASRADQHPNQLSGGQQQRVAIARALVNEPRLLVCDEPTAALDAESGRKVMELLRQVTVQPDRAVIIVTHDQRVMDLGDRIIELIDGQISNTKTTFH